MKPAGNTYRPSAPNIGKIPPGAPAGTGMGSPSQGAATGGDPVAAAGAGAAGTGTVAAALGGGVGSAGAAVSTGAAGGSGGTGAKGGSGAIGSAGSAGGSGAGDRKYIASKVMSASPAELILMMYEQFFELIPDIKQGIRKKSPALAEPHAERAQAIIDELINALDFSVDMSKDLGAIYFYVRDRILEANVKFDESIWDHISDTLRPLYDGFAEAAKQAAPGGAAKRQASKGQASVIVAGMTYGQNNLNEIVINTKNGLKA